MNWLKWRWLYFLFSGILIGSGGFFLLTQGLKLGLDFTGGSLLELKINAPLDRVEAAVSADLGAINIRQSGSGSFLIRANELDSAGNTALQVKLSQEFGSVEELRFETVGPVLGKELIQKTMIGLVLAVGFILIYLGWRFKDRVFGICAVLAMLHDSLIILGSFSFFGAVFGVEIDSLFVTAVLTILSFSVHDTIVLYDRIREDRRLYPQTSLAEIANRAISETMTRSINNSLTIIFMLVALLVLGGDTTRWFVTALLIGTISGTYSSPFTAVPLLVLLKRNSKRV